MEMVAAARLRRAEQRIEALRPYAQAIRKMTKQVAESAPAKVEGAPLLEERESLENVGVLLVTGDRGLAGSFNTQIIREGLRLKREFEAEGAEVVFSVVGRRGNSTLHFRGEQVDNSYVGFTDRPSFTDARAISKDLIASFIDGKLDRTLRGDSIVPEFLALLDAYVEDAVAYLVGRYGDELTTVITHTIDRWDGREAANRIELHVGRDLQFIRINGTIVGGLAGLVIHTLNVLL